MSDASIPEYIKIKVILYKYIPPFTYVPPKNNPDSETIKILYQNIQQTNNIIQKYQTRNDKLISKKERTGLLNQDLVNKFSQLMKQTSHDAAGSMDFFENGNSPGHKIFRALEGKEGLQDRLGDEVVWRTTRLVNKYLTTDFYKIDLLYKNMNIILKTEDTVRFRLGFGQTLDNRKFLWKQVAQFLDDNLNITSQQGYKDNIANNKAMISKLEAEVKVLQSQLDFYLKGLNKIERFSVPLSEDYFNKI